MFGYVWIQPNILLCTDMSEETSIQDFLVFFLQSTNHLDIWSMETVNHLYTKERDAFQSNNIFSSSTSHFLYCIGQGKLKIE